MNKSGPAVRLNGTDSNGSTGMNGLHIVGVGDTRAPRAHSSKNGFIDVELFAGAGGLTLGLTAAGLAPDYLFENNKHCCATLERNSRGPPRWVTGEICKEDVGAIDWSTIGKPVRVLSGGPPCQPFSFGGKHLAERDGRNQFPSTLRAVRALRPAVVFLENVPGFARSSFRPYLEYVVRQLECPSVVPRHGELWDDHDRRLQRHQAARGYTREYRVKWWLVSAADFGVAQARVRVVFVATRADLPAVASPTPTHSRAALVQEQESGDYWRKRGLRKKRRPEWPRRVQAGEGAAIGIEYEPWSTVRDALAGLSSPSRVENAEDNHWLIPGARLYQRHSGSEPDWPAKTIKAGVHGVAGGENVLLLENGRHRYFTLREMARLQCFPDDYCFTGPRSRIIEQIGNAVPVDLARVFGELLKPSLAPLDGHIEVTVTDGRGYSPSRLQGGIVSL